MTVGFGKGGSVDVKVTGKVIPAAENGGSLISTDIDALRALPFAGASILRLENGDRFQVAVTDVQVSRPVGWTGLRNVSVASKEVS